MPLLCNRLLTVLASLEDSYSGWSSRHPGCPTFPEQRLRSRGRDFSEVTSQDFRCQQGQSSFATQLCLLCFRSFFLRLWTLVNYGPWLWSGPRMRRLYPVLYSLAGAPHQGALSRPGCRLSKFCQATAAFLEVSQRLSARTACAWNRLLLPACWRHIWSSNFGCQATHDQASPLGCDFAAAFGGALPGTRTPWILDTYGAVASGSVK